jgi:hypothetical protein
VPASPTRLRTRAVEWAFDGRTAPVLHGLAGEAVDADVDADIAAVDSEALRWLLRGVEARPAGKDGMPLFDSWLSLDVSTPRTQPVALRLVPVAPGRRAARGAAGPRRGAVHPVLPLFEVERAHPTLADVLARLRTRGRTVRA